MHKENKVWLSDKYTHKSKLFHSIKDTSQGRDYDICKKFNQHQRKVFWDMLIILTSITHFMFIFKFIIQ